MTRPQRSLSSLVALATLFVACSDGGQAVPLMNEVYIADATATSFSVGVESCNGNPSFELTETDTEIRLAVTSWIPAGREGDACADLIEVALKQPVGDRTLIDDLTGRIVPVIADG